MSKSYIDSDSFKIYKAEDAKEVLSPYFGAANAGFPSPAADFTGQRIDLNQLCINNPESTFLAKAVGDSMNQDFREGDLLVVDSSLEYEDNRIALIFTDGDFTVKRIRIEEERMFLVSSNKDFPPIEVMPESEIRIFGIITWSLRKHL